MDEWGFKPGWVVPEWLMQRCTEIIWHDFFIWKCDLQADRDDFFEYSLHIDDEFSFHMPGGLMDAVVRRYRHFRYTMDFVGLVVDYANWAELHRRMEEKLNAE